MSSLVDLSAPGEGSSQHRVALRVHAGHDAGLRVPWGAGQEPTTQAGNLQYRCTTDLCLIVSAEP